MAIEIERKFLVSGGGWRKMVTRSEEIADHLIARFDKGKARIRISGLSATLTIKGNRAGLSRSEFHLTLAHDDAIAMIAEFATGPAIEKCRHDVPVGGLVWQVDEYRGALAGLITADVELSDESSAIEVPDWARTEVTHDPRYSAGTLMARLRSSGNSLNDIPGVALSRRENCLFPKT